MTTLLSTHQLKIRIGNKQICTGLSAGIQAGEVWGLLGGNGAGKTTLLHTLARLRKPDSGQILYKNELLSGINSRKKARMCGILLQDDESQFPATVMETVLQGRHPHLSLWQWEGEDDEQIALDALIKTDLAEHKDKNVTQLSGGEKQRLKIATLLVQNPDILLADEPTNHLDLPHQINLLKLLTDRVRSNSQTLLMSLHDLNLVWRFCDKVILLYPDREPETGNTVDLLIPDHLEALYQHPIHCLDTDKGRLFVAA